MSRRRREGVLHLSERVTLVDHTSCEPFAQFASYFEKSGRGTVVIEGLDEMFVARTIGRA